MIYDEEGTKDDDTLMEEEMLTEDKKMKACLNSITVVGCSSQKNMKLVGQLHERRVAILLDSRAMHNFISKNWYRF